MRNVAIRSMTSVMCGEQDGQWVEYSCAVVDIPYRAEHGRISGTHSARTVGQCGKAVSQHHEVAIRWLHGPSSDLQ